MQKNPQITVSFCVLNWQIHFFNKRKSFCGGNVLRAANTFNVSLNNVSGVTSCYEKLVLNYICVCLYRNILVCICYIEVFLSVCMCACILACVCAYSFVFVCMCVYVRLEGLFYSAFVHCTVVHVSQTDLIRLILLGLGHY